MIKAPIRYKYSSSMTIRTALLIFVFAAVMLSASKTRVATGGRSFRDLRQQSGLPTSNTTTIITNATHIENATNINASGIFLAALENRTILDFPPAPAATATPTASPTQEKFAPLTFSLTFSLTPEPTPIPTLLPTGWPTETPCPATILHAATIEINYLFQEYSTYPGDEDADSLAYYFLLGELSRSYGDALQSYDWISSQVFDRSRDPDAWPGGRWSIVFESRAVFLPCAPSLADFTQATSNINWDALADELYTDPNGFGAEGNMVVRLLQTTTVAPTYAPTPKPPLPAGVEYAP